MKIWGNKLNIGDNYYTEKQEVIDELLEHLKKKCRLDIIIQEEKIKEHKLKIKHINNKLKELNKLDK